MGTCGGKYNPQSQFLCLSATILCDCPFFNNHSLSIQDFKTLRWQICSRDALQILEHCIILHDVGHLFCVVSKIG
jgi:hypothetical protein